MNTKDAATDTPASAVAVRSECPECEGLGCIAGEWAGKPARVTCPRCKGNEFIVTAAPPPIAGSAADELQARVAPVIAPGEPFGWFRENLSPGSATPDQFTRNPAHAEVWRQRYEVRPLYLSPPPSTGAAPVGSQQSGSGEAAPVAEQYRIAASAVCEARNKWSGLYEERWLEFDEGEHPDDYIGRMVVDALNAASPPAAPVANGTEAAVAEPESYERRIARIGCWCTRPDARACAGDKHISPQQSCMCECHTAPPPIARSADAEPMTVQLTDTEWARRVVESCLTSIKKHWRGKEAAHVIEKLKALLNNSPFRAQSAATDTRADDGLLPMNERIKATFRFLEKGWMNGSHVSYEEAWDMLQRAAGALPIARSAADELSTLRQAVWGALGHLGFDRDGDPTPAALTYPPLSKLIVDVAKEFRAEYDECLRSDAAPVGSQQSGSGEATVSDAMVEAAQTVLGQDSCKNPCVIYVRSALEAALAAQTSPPASGVGDARKIAADALRSAGFDVRDCYSRGIDLLSDPPQRMAEIFVVLAASSDTQARSK